LSVKYCPECRHELAGRGRYCLFCGCDLRKSQQAVPAKAPEARSDGGRWDPETAYRRGAAGRIVFWALLLAALAAAAVLYFSSPKTQLPSFTAGISFENAYREMRRCGFVPLGDPVKQGQATTQRYGSSEVYGIRTVCTDLEVREGTGAAVTLVHYYRDGSKKDQSRSQTFARLKKTLSDRYGDPELIHTQQDYYYWPDDNGYRILSVMDGSIVVGEIME